MTRLQSGRTAVDTREVRRTRAVAVLLGLVLAVAGCSSDVPVHSTGAAIPSTTVTAPGPAVAAPPAVPTTTAALASSPPSPPTAPPPTVVERPAANLPQGEDTTVESVVDGDTIVVAGGTRVRLIGVDTPETKDPRTPVQCFGVEAAARTASLVEPGAPVRLVYDVERLDRYGRTLAYVYRRADGLFVNAALVAEGYALVATFPPNVAHAEELTALARTAREEGRGLWSSCGDEPAPPPPPPAAPPSAGSGGGSCHPSYPDACIPPAPPDLDCGDISERRFRVLPPDPHGFDGRDDDGLGCES